MSNPTEQWTDQAYTYESTTPPSTNTAGDHNVPETTQHTESKASRPISHFRPRLKRQTLARDFSWLEYTTPFSEKDRRCFIRQLPPGDGRKECWLPSVTDDQLNHFAEKFSVPEDDAAHTKLSQMISWCAYELLSEHRYYTLAMCNDCLEPSLIEQIKDNFFVKGIATDLPGLEYELPEDPGPRVTIDSLFSLAGDLLSAFASMQDPMVPVTAKTALASSVPSEAT